MTLAGRHGLRVLQLGPAMGVRGAVDLKAQWAIGEAAARRGRRCAGMSGAW